MSRPPGCPTTVESLASLVRAAWCDHVGRVGRHPRAALLLVGVACLPLSWLTIRFLGTIETGLDDLLPASAPTVRALREVQARMGGESHLTILVRSPDPAQNRRFISTLADRLRARRIPEVRTIQADVAAERAWLRAHAALLLPSERFEHYAGELERQLDRGKARLNPFLVDLDDPEQRRKGWTQLADELRAEQAGADRFPRGFLERPDGRLVVALVWLEGSDVDTAPSARLLAAVRDEVAALRPGFRPDLAVDYSGRVAFLLEEEAAIRDDLSLSTALVLSVVALLIAVWFGSVRALGAVLLCLVPGVLASFAVGFFTVGHVNATTAFLGSIIAGNGVNYPLLLFACYHARPPEEPREVALLGAARLALPGTLAAAVTASAAFAALALSSVRVFGQFGWLGGAGMILTWLITFLVAPIAVAACDPPRLGRPAGLHSDDEPGRHRGLRVPSPRRSLPAVVVLLAAALCAAVGVGRALRGGLFETNLRALRNTESLRTGASSWESQLNDLFGVWLSPVVGLVAQGSDREAAAEELRRAVARSAASGPPLVERVETVERYRPPAPEQERRLARLARLRDAIAALPAGELPEELASPLTDLLGTDALRPITLDSIPPSLRGPFADRSGDVERTVLVYPSNAVDFDDARNVERLSDVIGEARLPPGTVVGGGFLLMSEVLRTLRIEAPRVLLLVVVLVVLVLLPMFASRPSRIPLILLTVAAVTLVAQCALYAVGVRINLVNFAAVPITVGVGADYVVNLVGAMDGLGVGAARARERLGGAILLCSLTTIVGYATLLRAQSGALRSFGWAAVLGEVLAVAAVLIVIPGLFPGDDANARAIPRGDDRGD